MRELPGSIESRNKRKSLERALSKVSRFKDFLLSVNIIQFLTRFLPASILRKMNRRMVNPHNEEPP